MNGAAEQEQFRVLPLREVIRDVVYVPWSLRQKLFNALLIPGAALILIRLIYPVESRFLFQILFLIAQGVVSALFAVTCHRIYLLKHDAIGKWGQTAWTKRETRFFFWGLGIYLIYSVISAVLIMFTTMAAALFSGDVSDDLDKIIMWLVYITMIPGTYVLARLSLVLPATAIDKRPDISWAWSLSAGNGWRLTVIVGLLPWLLYGPITLLSPDEETIISSVLIQAFIIIVMALEIAALSFSYRKLIEMTDIPENVTPAVGEDNAI